MTRRFTARVRLAGVFLASASALATTLFAIFSSGYKLAGSGVPAETAFWLGVWRTELLFGLASLGVLGVMLWNISRRHSSFSHVWLADGWLSWILAHKIRALALLCLAAGCAVIVGRSLNRYWTTKKSILRYYSYQALDDARKLVMEGHLEDAKSLLETASHALQSSRCRDAISGLAEYEKKMSGYVSILQSLPLSSLRQEREFAALAQGSSTGHYIAIVRQTIDERARERARLSEIFTRGLLELRAGASGEAARLLTQVFAKDPYLFNVGEWLMEMRGESKARGYLPCMEWLKIGDPARIQSFAQHWLRDPHDAIEQPQVRVDFTPKGQHLAEASSDPLKPDTLYHLKAGGQVALAGPSFDQVRWTPPATIREVPVEAVPSPPLPQKAEEAPSPMMAEAAKAQEFLQRLTRAVEEHDWQALITLSSKSGKITPGADSDEAEWIVELLGIETDDSKLVPLGEKVRLTYLNQLKTIEYTGMTMDMSDPNIQVSAQLVMDEGTRIAADFRVTRLGPESYQLAPLSSDEEEEEEGTR